MKVFLVLLLATVALADRPKRWLIDSCTGDGQCGKGKCCLLDKLCAPGIILPKYAPCSLSHFTDCLICPDGTSCTAYTEIEIGGTKVQLKSCLPPDAIPSTLTSVDNEIKDHKRFLTDNLPKQCAVESECGPGKCCLFNKFCSPRLPQYSPCNLVDHHKCGCTAGTSCQGKEYEIFGKKFTLNFCFPDA